MTVVSVAVETTKFLLRMYDCTVDSDVGMGDFSLVPGILHLRSHVDTRTCDRTCLWTWTAYGHEMSFLCLPEENSQPCLFSSLIFTNQLPLARQGTALILPVHNCL